MADYTPSAQEVRDAYIYVNSLDGESAPADEEFDRWFWRVQAEAWDKGWVAGIQNWASGFFENSQQSNPYRNG